MRTPLCLLAALAIVAGGCSIHRVEVRQGNEFVFENAGELSVGDDMETVRGLLGPPHVVNGFRPGEWYYFNRTRQGNEVLADQSLLLVFDEERRLAEINLAPAPDSDAQ